MFNISSPPMSKPFTVKFLEQCKVTPPPNATPTTSTLPLTFLDLPWLFFSPSQPLFFYEFPHPISHFTATTIPKLKHSLSLTLQHYYPFAGTFFVPSPPPSKPHLYYANDTSSISLTFAVTNGADFQHLCSNHQRDVTYFHPLVPNLESTLSRDEKEIPLLSIQVTLFPNFGICIGIAFHHVVADGRTFSNFFKTWASYCSSNSPLSSLPFYDRSVIVDSRGLEEVFMKEWNRRRTQEKDIAIGRIRNPNLSSDLSNSGMVRATFLIGVTEMEKIKRFIVDYCREKNQSQPLHLSAYVLTCSFLWVCLAKTQQSFNVNVNGKLQGKLDHDEDPTYFGFIAGGITRLDFPVPKTYLGNCVGFGRATVNKKRELLLAESGIVVAANAIGSTIKNLDASIFDEAEKWVLDWGVLLNESEQQQRHVHATWSPKLKLYDESDFGWGRPKKIEEVSIDSTRAVSLIQSRDFEGGIEIGLALPKNQMDDFTIFFNQGLDALP